MYIYTISPLLYFIHIIEPPVGYGFGPNNLNAVQEATSDPVIKNLQSQLAAAMQEIQALKGGPSPAVTPSATRTTATPPSSAKAVSTPGSKTPKSTVPCQDYHWFFKNVGIIIGNPETIYSIMYMWSHRMFRQ